VTFPAGYFPGGAFPTGYAAVVAGAGSGIGRATAVALAARGVRLTVLGRNPQRIETLVAELTARGARVNGDLLDATDDAAVARVLGAAMARHGTVHALVNAVGVQPDTGVASHLAELERFDLAYRTNLRAALVLTRGLLPHMLDRGYGRIAHVASMAGKEGNPRMVSYSASKAGLIGMVKALGKEYARTGVVINAIAPAVIRTKLIEATPPDLVAELVAKIPMGRTGELPEVAELLSWMVSPACSFTTGFTFDLSGGRATY
jgi:2-dehydro-3-deoxy-L-rhamnonate dehydrogenase (NAD+)